MNKKVLGIGALLVLGLFLYAGCGNALQEGVSPRLTDYTLAGECDGDENSQFVVLSLQFDREINYAEDFADDLRITIADERQKADNFQMWQDSADSVTLRMPVSAVTTGKLHIEPIKQGEPLTGITDKTEGAPAYPFTIDAIIPSGVDLETVAARGGTVVKRVVGTWNIRNITWVQLWADGELVQPVVTDSLEILDGAVAVHGHDFLTSDEFVIAEEIVDTLQKFYGDEYLFAAEDDTVIVKAADSAKVLDLKIYSFHELAVEEVQ